MGQVHGPPDQWRGLPPPDTMGDDLIGGEAVVFHGEYRHLMPVVQAGAQAPCDHVVGVEVQVVIVTQIGATETGNQVDRIANLQTQRPAPQSHPRPFAMKAPPVPSHSSRCTHTPCGFA